MDNLVDLFCAVDAFCQIIIPELNKVSLSHSSRQQQKGSRLSRSEIMTIIIHFHQSHYRDFKTYYIYHIMQHLKHAFPQLVSYNRFIELMPSVILLLCLFIQLQVFILLTLLPYPYVIINAHQAIRYSKD